MESTESTALLNGNSWKDGTHIVDMTSYKTEKLNDCGIPSILNYEDLLYYKNDPWWQNFRRSVLITFWISLCLTFFTACSLSYLQKGSCQISTMSSFEGTTVEEITIASISTLAS